MREPLASSRGCWTTLPDALRRRSPADTLAYGSRHHRGLEDLGRDDARHGASATTRTPHAHLGRFNGAYLERAVRCQPPIG